VQNANEEEDEKTNLQTKAKCENRKNNKEKKNKFYYMQICTANKLRNSGMILAIIFQPFVFPPLVGENNEGTSNEIQLEVLNYKWSRRKYFDFLLREKEEENCREGNWNGIRNGSEGFERRKLFDKAF
jgi:hypothetical protein